MIVLFAAIIVVGAMIIGVPEPPLHKTSSVTVKVEELVEGAVAETGTGNGISDAGAEEKSGDDASIPILSIDDLHKPLRLIVKDPKQPPEVTPEQSPQQVVAETKQAIPAYEEKNLVADVPVVAKQKFEGRPRIAIVIDDVGMNLSMTDRITQLPAAITMSFLPYSPKLQAQADKATAAGHELMLHIPMQPKGVDDPGAGALFTDMSADEVREQLNKALGSFYGFDGVNNHMGSKFTASREQMATVIDVLKQRQVFFLDSRTSGKSVAAKVAQEQGLLNISRDVFMDNDVSESAIKKQLVIAEQIAKRKGYAVVIGHPHISTVKALEAWLPEAEKHGIDLVSLKVLVK